MSWSIDFTGKPVAIGVEIDRHSDKLSGQSKIEFDEARPLLRGLLAQNFQNVKGGYEPIVRLQANGSGSASTDPTTKETVQQSRDCMVKLERVGNLCV